MKHVISLAVLSALVPALAHAETSEEIRTRRATSSSEYASFELGLGPYQPAQMLNERNATNLVFDGDDGPMLRIEIDGWLYRIPYVGLIGVGVSWGWAEYSERLCSNSSCSGRIDEEGSLTLFPLAPLAVLRADVLARELGVPLVLSGKIGADFIFWTAKGGGNGRGTAIGLRWAVQAAIELDFINPRRARSLDEDWGINHTTLYFELIGSTAQQSYTAGGQARQLKFGTALSWIIGLGLHL